MRVTNKAMYDGIVQNLGTTSEEMIKAHKVVSSGKKINRLSDDPVGFTTVLDLRSSLAHIDQLERNIVLGRSWLVAGESVLDQASEIISKTKELTLQMSDDTNSRTNRENSANVVDGYLRQILSLANSKVGGRYIFGGTNTDNSPFSFNSDETEVLYEGNSTSFSIKIGKDSSIEIGRDGKDIFGESWNGENIFKTLMDLKSHLINNDIDGIRGTLDKLDAHFDNLQAFISDTGGKAIRLDVKEKIIKDLDFTYTDRKSQLEEADIAEAIMKLNTKELAYNASLASSAKVMQLSLVNFL